MRLSGTEGAGLAGLKDGSESCIQEWKGLSPNQDRASLNKLPFTGMERVPSKAGLSQRLSQKRSWPSQPAA